MKTLADFKRRIQLGVKLHGIFHRKFKEHDPENPLRIVYCDEDKGIREVSIVQSNAFALKTPSTGQTAPFVNSWMHYPPAKMFKVIDDNTIQFMEPDVENKLIPFITYKFVN